MTDTQNTSRENQTVTIQGVGYYAKKNKVVGNVTVTRIGNRKSDGATYGTCKINDIATGVLLIDGNRWKVQ